MPVVVTESELWGSVEVDRAEGILKLQQEADRAVSRLQCKFFSGLSAIPESR
jgi:hypothetical protein